MIALERRAAGPTLVATPGAIGRFVGAAVVALAFLLRVAGLTLVPLQLPESAPAYQAWRLYHGLLDGYAGPPLLTNLQALAFFLFGDTDLAARLPSLVCGLGLVALPLCMRRLDPAWRLAASLLLAISALEIMAARSGTTPALVAFLFGLLAVAAWNVAAAPGRGWAITGAVALGLGVAADPAFVLSLLVGLLAALAAWWRGGARWRPGPRERALGPLLLAVALVSFVLGSSYLLTTPIGLQAGLTNLWRWTTDLGPAEPARLLAWPLEDPLPLICGAVGAGLILRARRARAYPLVIWAALQVLLALVAGAPDPRYLALAVLPLALLGGVALVALLDARDRLSAPVWAIGTLALVPIVFLFFSAIQRAANAQPFSPVIPLFGLGAFGLIVLFATTVLPRRAAPAALLVAALLLGLFLQVRGIAALTVATPRPGASLLAPRAVLPAMFEVEATATRWARADRTAPITVDERLRPLLQWPLRDVETARFVRPQPPLGGGAILEPDASPALLAGRRASRVPIQATADALDAFSDPALAIRWIASREIPNGSEAHAILLAR